MSFVFMSFYVICYSTYDLKHLNINPHICNDKKDNNVLHDFHHYQFSKGKRQNTVLPQDQQANHNKYAFVVDFDIYNKTNKDLKCLKPLDKTSNYTTCRSTMPTTRPS